MDAVGVIHPSAAVAGTGLPATFGCCQSSARTGRLSVHDTLHCNSGAPGSAAQFNQSVSAMPSHDPRNFARLSRQGTADTLS
jgi:hypothetical protein